MKACIVNCQEGFCFSCSLLPPSLEANQGQHNHCEHDGDCFVGGHIFIKLIGRDHGADGRQQAGQG
jgi:hypothetical protein